MHIHITGPWAAALTGALLAVAIVPAAVALISHDRGSGPAGTAPDRSDDGAGAMDPAVSATSSSAPWGQLKLVHMETQAPDELIATKEFEGRARRWVLPGYTPQRLQTLLEATELTASQRQRLLASAQADPSIQGLVLLPDEELLLSMSPRSRTVLYTALGMFPQNQPEYDPFRYPAELVNEWLDADGVAPETINRIRALLYPRGPCLALSDAPLVLKTLATHEEKVHVLRMLLQQPSLLMRLHIGPNSDIAALTKYWSANGRVKNVGPLLESMSRIPGGCDTGVVHLLPPFARAHLYCYSGQGFGYDCHWASLNFWSANSEGDDRYLDTTNVRDAFETKYLPVASPYKYGDLILFKADDSHTVHSGIYLADDVLYTKNGGTARSPCTLTTLDHLTDYYRATYPGLQVVGMRMKD